ncbi:MAG TPA: hypothetical protein VN814_10095 [Caulobacteraceae bacterium]|nr:hypothetical protein [Caulobacteraceae bacterium]
MASPIKTAAWLGGAFVALGLIGTPCAAVAADQAAPAPSASPSTSDVDALRAHEAEDSKRLDEQSALLKEQANQLAETRALVEQQQDELSELKQALGDAQAKLTQANPAPAEDQRLEIAELNDTRGAGVPAGGQPVGGQPVGEAPPTHANAALALPLPQGIDVLTPRGHLVLDNAVEYQNASSDRVVFEGIQIINAIQLGLLEANQTSDNTGIVLNTVRYGLTNHIDFELTVPWVGRADRVTTVQTVTPPTDLTNQFNITGGGIGDVEGTLRYQFNEGRNGGPLFVAAMRVVSNSGTGPFQVKYNELGVATKLPTGSGFWQINPTFTTIYPLDPVVLFGTVGYQHGFGQDIDKYFGTGQSLTHVGKVAPGDSVYAALGFVFSLNSHFSYSLGYKHTYFFPTVTEFLPTANNVGIVKARTLALNDGVLLAGASYRFNDHVSVNLNWEYGVTADAPNDTIILRVPYLF